MVLTELRHEATARSTLSMSAACAIVALCLVIPGVSGTRGVAVAAGAPLDGTSAPDTAAPDGRWRVARDAGGILTDLSEEQEEDLARLESLGYLSGYNPAPAVSGVTKHDKSRAFDGYNFYTSGHFPGAILMDMEGNVLHEWRYEFLDAWPDCPESVLSADAPYAHLVNPDFWFRARVFGNGDVMAMFEGLGLIMVDKDSNLVWKIQVTCHHDFEILEDGRIYVLCRQERTQELMEEEHSILDEFIAKFDPNEGTGERVSVMDAFMQSNYASYLLEMDFGGDLFHANKLEILDGRLADRIPAFKEGNVLISLREPGLVAVVDLESQTVVWALKGLWRRQHHPTVLPNGNMLVFDNQGNFGYSRVIEFDPVSQEVKWMYAGEERSDFFSRTCGTNQRLPNGNTLITESDNGRALEVARDGTIAWEYVNTARAGEDGELIATLFEVVRLPSDFPTDWAEARQ